MEIYGQNLTSLWEKFKACGVSPGVHKGLLDLLLVTHKPRRVTNTTGITGNE